MVRIPLVDLRQQTGSLRKEVFGVLQSVINTADFVGGEEITKFEQHFARFVGAKFCVACGNGTDAIEIALQALNIERQAEVLVPAHTWISTAEAVNNVGAEPIFVDVDPEYYTIDPADISRKITTRTRAIIPVHLYGQPADMDAILDIAQQYGLYVVEDCAQAHGAEYRGKKVGTWGHIGTFSFYPGKNLGAFGDAGAIVTNDPQLAERCRLIRNHGQRQKHQHQMIGRNSRMDTLQAAVLNVKLPYLDQWNEQRRAKAQVYRQLLEGIGDVILPSERPDSSHVYHLFVIRTSKRNQLKHYLHQHGIGVAVHYPNALPFVEAYAYKQHCREDFPKIDSYIDCILSLPMYPELTTEQQQYIASRIKQFFE